MLDSARCRWRAIVGVAGVAVNGSQGPNGVQPRGRIVLARATGEDLLVQWRRTRSSAATEPHRSIVTTVHLQLLENVVHVVLDGRQLDSELLRDRLIREAFGDQIG